MTARHACQRAINTACGKVLRGTGSKRQETRGRWGVKLVAAMDEDFDEERVRLRPLSAIAFAGAVLMSGAILFNTLIGGGASTKHRVAGGEEGTTSMVVDAGDGNAQVVTMRYEPMVESLQRDLKSLGRYDGPVDGVIGKRTKQAIMAFQRENGLNVDGEPNDELLDRVAFARRIAEAAGFTSSTGIAEGDETVRKIQAKLAELGYEPGTADGFMGDKTREAIANFERDRGLPQTGAATPQILAEIERMTGQSGSAPD